MCGLAVGQLHEVAEVLDRAVAPAAVQVVHERRAVVRGEDRGRCRRSATFVARVAGVLRELARARSPGRSGGTSRAGTGRARPATSAPAAAQEARRRPGRRGTRGPTSWRIVSALCSMRASPSSSRTSNGLPACGSGTASAPAVRCRRAAWRAARPPLRWRGVSSITGPPCWPRRRRGRRRSRPSGRREAHGRPAAPAGPRRGPGGSTGRSDAGTPWRPRSAPGSRGSTAVSIFSTWRTTASISRRARPDRRAIRAPGAGGVAGGHDVRRVAVGDRGPAPSRGCRSIWLPNAPARRTSSTASTPA